MCENPENERLEGLGTGLATIAGTFVVNSPASVSLLFTWVNVKQHLVHGWEGKCSGMIRGDRMHLLKAPGYENSV